MSGKMLDSTEEQKQEQEALQDRVRIPVVKPLYRIGCSQGVPVQNLAISACGKFLGCASRDQIVYVFNIDPSFCSNREKQQEEKEEKTEPFSLVATYESKMHTFPAAPVLVFFSPFPLSSSATNGNFSDEHVLIINDASGNLQFLSVEKNFKSTGPSGELEGSSFGEITSVAITSCSRLMLAAQGSCARLYALDGDPSQPLKSLDSSSSSSTVHRVLISPFHIHHQDEEEEEKQQQLIGSGLGNQNTKKERNFALALWSRSGGVAVSVLDIRNRKLSASRTSLDEMVPIVDDRSSSSSSFSTRKQGQANEPEEEDEEQEEEEKFTYGVASVKNEAKKKKNAKPGTRAEVSPSGGGWASSFTFFNRDKGNGKIETLLAVQADSLSQKNTQDNRRDFFASRSLSPSSSSSSSHGIVEIATADLYDKVGLLDVSEYVKNRKIGFSRFVSASPPSSSSFHKYSSSSSSSSSYENLQRKTQSNLLAVSYQSKSVLAFFDPSTSSSSSSSEQFKPILFRNKQGQLVPLVRLRLPDVKDSDSEEDEHEENDKIQKPLRLFDNENSSSRSSSSSSSESDDDNDNEFAEAIHYLKKQRSQRKKSHEMRYQHVKTSITNTSSNNALLKSNSNSNQKKKEKDVIYQKPRASATGNTKTAKPEKNHAKPTQLRHPDYYSTIWSVMFHPTLPLVFAASACGIVFVLKNPEGALRFDRRKPLFLIRDKTKPEEEEKEKGEEKKKSRMCDAFSIYNICVLTGWFLSA